MVHKSQIRICGGSANLTNYLGPQICRFVICGIYLRTAHLRLNHHTVQDSYTAWKTFLDFLKNCWQISQSSTCGYVNWACILIAVIVVFHRRRFFVHRHRRQGRHRHWPGWRDCRRRCRRRILAADNAAAWAAGRLGSISGSAILRAQFGVSGEEILPVPVTVFHAVKKNNIVQSYIQIKQL